ncbi:hypothetical protein NCCP2145_12520 [Pseudarthrobacter sp. NCCP-2145]|nr:hypothetical protein NCCP2145_12520 [Pseudarthrobacter sp. NCCP-2145]
MDMKGPLPLPAGLAVGFGWETPGRSSSTRQESRLHPKACPKQATIGFPVSAGRMMRTDPEAAAELGNLLRSAAF